jgi:hypothetical protein
MQVAGFLRLIADGLVPVPTHAREEAGALLDKVAELLAP